MDGDSISTLIVILILIALSAFFSGTETTFSSYNKIKMKSLASAEDARADLILRIEDNYDKLITTVLIGNNIVNITLTTVSTLFFMDLLRNLEESAVATISTAVVTITVLIFGEITPKVLAKEHADGYVRATCKIISFLMSLLTPITFIFSMWKKLLGKIFKTNDSSVTTGDELITMVEEAEQDGGIDEEEGELIRSAIEFSEMTAGEILTPRIDIVAIDENADFREVMMLFFESGYSRLPVIGDSIDDIKGVLHEKDFFYAYNSGNTSFKEHIQEPLYISKHDKIDELLRKFQEEKCHMAFVIDEFGGLMGIVTMEDIIEELIGDVWDEHDEVETHFTPNEDGSLSVDCSVELDDIFDHLEIKFDDEDGEKPVTLNGWLQMKSEGIPETGDTVEYNDIEFEIVNSDSKMVKEVIIRDNREKESDEKEKDKSKVKEQEESDKK
ncbi:MAG: HlyC/CorC family transporter [Clostridia bacterium]|nr:HlyC/CorC family transporter [Clostridia bacterium]